jgi:hypothetical protein
LRYDIDQVNGSTRAYISTVMKTSNIGGLPRATRARHAEPGPMDIEATLGALP